MVICYYGKFEFEFLYEQITIKVNRNKKQKIYGLR